MAAARRSRRTRNTGRSVRIAAEDGGPAIPITGAGDGRAILPSLNTTAKSSESGIRSGGCAILPTTTQLGRKSGFWKHFRLAAAHRWNLANNNALVWMRLPPDKGKRPCFRPNRSTTCIGCTGPSTGRSVTSNAICAWAGIPSGSISMRRRKVRRHGHAPANSMRLGHHCRMAGEGCHCLRRSD